MKPVSKLLCVGLCALGLAGCGGAAERKAKYLERGRQLYEQGKPEKAQLELRNALQIDPKFVEARYLLGRVMEQTQAYPVAAGNYLAVIDADATHVDARVRLGLLFLRGNALDRATNMADQAMKLAPTNPDVFTLRGGIRVAKGDIAGAIEDAQAVLKDHPGHLDAIGLLAGIYSRNKQGDKAVALLNAGIERNAKDVALRLMLAETYIAMASHDQAAKQFREVVRIEPEKLAHRLRLAAFLADQNNLDEAEKVLREAIARDAAVPEPKLALVSFLAGRRERVQAERELLAFIAQDPTAHNLRFGLARLYEAAGDAEKLAATYQQIIDLDGIKPPGLQARVRLAQLRLAQGKTADAENLLAEVLDENPRDNDALLLRGRIALQRDDVAGAIADFRSLLKDQPMSSELLKLLSAAHFRNGEQTLALDNLRKALELNPQDLAARVQYASALARTGETGPAKTEFTKILTIDPKHVGALEGLFRIQMSTNDVAGAKQSARQIQAAQPDVGLGYYLNGLVQQGQKNYPASVADFETALRKSPRAPEPLTALVASLIAMKQLEVAEKRVERVLAETQDHAVAHNLAGEILLLRRKPKQAITAFEKAAELLPRQPLAYKNIALAHLAQNDFDSAERAYRRGLDASNNDPGLRLELAMLFQRSGKSDRAIAEYEEILKRLPNSQVAANNLAMLLVTQRDDKESLARAATLTNRLVGTDNAAFLDTVGWVRYRHGDNDGAVAALKRALEKAPGEPMLHYHLGMAHYGKGDHDAARRHLREALESKADFQGRDDARTTLDKLRSS